MTIYVGAAASTFLSADNASYGVGVGIATTTTTGRDAGIGTANGSLVFNSTTRQVEVYYDGEWTGGLTRSFRATGGTEDVATRPGWKVHTFTGSGAFQVFNASIPGAQYLIIGGGGGGMYGGGGGGAVIYKTGVTLPVGTYPVTIGGGGPSSYFSGPGSGVDSNFNSLTADGGGAGGYPGSNPPGTGAVLAGGSGGGSYGTPPYAGGPATGAPGGSNNTASPDSGWGNPGGSGGPGGPLGGGGGGAGGAGGAATPTPTTFFGSSVPAPHGIGGNGGNGLSFGITGVDLYYAGGGGGVSFFQPNPPSHPSGLSPLRGGTGGLGGGGSARPGNANDQRGRVNSGSGGGSESAQGTGGSGIVIIAYPTS